MPVESRKISDHFMHWLYYLIGGIYVSNKFSNRQKYAWLSLNVFIFLLIIFCEVGYLLTATSVNVWTLFSSATVPWLSFYVIVLIPSFICYHRENFIKLLSFIEKNSNSVEDCGKNVPELKMLPIKQKNLFTDVVNWSLFFVWAVLTFVLAPLVNIAFISIDRNHLIHSIHQHIMGIPYMDYIPSVATFWVLYIVESLFLLLILTFMNFELALLIIIFNKLNNIAIDCCIDIQNYKGEINPEMENSIQSIIQRYQNLVKAIKLIQPFMELIYTIIGVGILFGDVIIICILMQPNLDILLKLKVLGSFAGAFGFLYAHCQFQLRIDEMTEGISIQVYNLPWYYAPPKRRKMIYIFLNQTQWPIVIKAFGVFPANVTWIPKILNVTYSIFNFFPALAKKHCKLT